MKLLRAWLDEKNKKAAADNELFLLRHISSAHKKIFVNYKKYNMAGRIIKKGNEIISYTFGSPINFDTFCIFIEISNPKIKGASQYIFREFCRELKSFKFINTMGDEGIEGLKLAKSLYKPAFKAINYIVSH